MSIKKLPITVIILTKNEEKAIQNCIETLDDFDQVVVVDSRSFDDTCAIAQAMGAEIVQFEWDGKYPKKKQWSMEIPSIRNDWVLFLDADERLSNDLKREIEDFFTQTKNHEFSAGVAPLKYYFNMRKLNHGHKVKKIFLLKKGFAKFPVIDDLRVSNMWEVEGHYQPQVRGQVFRFKGSILHKDPDSFFDYFARHNRYSDWEAFLRVNPTIATTVSETKSFQGKVFSKIPMKPIFFFIYSYFLRGGWLDGRQGLDYAIALSFYYWQIGLKSRELKHYR